MAGTSLPFCGIKLEVPTSEYVGEQIFLCRFQTSPSADTRLGPNNFKILYSPVCFGKFHLRRVMSYDSQKAHELTSASENVSLPLPRRGLLQRTRPLAAGTTKQLKRYPIRTSERLVICETLVGDSPTLNRLGLHVRAYFSFHVTVFSGLRPNKDGQMLVFLVVLRCPG